MLSPAPAAEPHGLREHADDPARAGRAGLDGAHGSDERRGLTPLAWEHVNPYGLFRLDMATRLPLDMPAPGADSGQLLFQGV